MAMHEHAIESPALSLRRYGAVSAWDIHPFHQIVLGLDGAMEMTVEGTGHRLDASHAWLIPAGSRHDYAGIGENRQLVLDVPCASLALPERFFSKALPLAVDDSFTDIVREAAAHAARIEMQQAWASANRVADPALHRSPQAEVEVGVKVGVAAEAQAHAVLAAERARRLAWNTAARLALVIGEYIGIEAPDSGLDYARIDKWLRTHLSEPLRVSDLAAHCGLGIRRFHQLFDEAFGTTPHRYLQRLRLDTALALLCDPRQTLAEVALTVGFADQSTFTHAFTRRFGLAPGQWRAMRMH